MGTNLFRLLCHLVLLTGFIRGVVSGGLKWVRVNVPQYRVPGETALLECDYDLGNDSLYAVKWYKDHEEFYRFVPKARPQASSYQVEGVNVDMSKSDSRKVVLHSVSWKTSGLFRCEVSAEKPSFDSAQSDARMEVVYESEFTLQAILNTHNVRYWIVDNPFYVRECHAQRPCGGLGNHILGLSFIGGNLNGETYLNLPRDSVISEIEIEITETG